MYTLVASFLCNTIVCQIVLLFDVTIVQSDVTIVVL